MDASDNHFRKNQKYVGRYAPTPTGSLHLGNLRTALASWLHAHHHSGKLLIRVDDLDTNRVKEDKIQEQCDDLLLLGLRTEKTVLQSQRISVYEAAFEKLKKSREIYPCFCSRKQITKYWKSQGKDSLLYPGTCRDLDPDSAARRIQNGDQHSWRFRIDHDEFIFPDGFMGDVTNAHHLFRKDGALDDFIIKRADGVFGYHLACAVDDSSFRINNVVRGDDLLESAVCQSEAMKALGVSVPSYFHLPMITGENDRKLSKSEDADDLRWFMKRNYSMNQVLGYLAWTLGQTGLGETPLLDELAKNFCIDKVPREPVSFQESDLSSWRANTS